MIALWPRPMGGVHEGESTMKKIVTFATVAGCALVLTACNKTEEAPAAEATADTEMMAPAATDTPAATETLDPTGNPIGPGKTAADAPMAVETPAE